MRIGDKVLCTAGHGWAAGKMVEIKGIIRDYRTIRDNAALEAMGGIRDSDQIIFSVLDADGFRYSSPDGKLADFLEGPVLSKVEGVKEPVEFTTLVQTLTPGSRV